MDSRSWHSKNKENLIRREQFFFVDLNSPIEALGLRDRILWKCPLLSYSLVSLSSRSVPDGFFSSHCIGHGEFYMGDRNNEGIQPLSI